MMVTEKIGKLIGNWWMVVLSVTILSCGATSDSIDNETAAKSSADQESITTVTTAIAENKNFEYLIHTNGKVRSLHEHIITSEIGGKVLECHVQTGIKISAGTVILQMETTPAKLRLERAKLSLFNSSKEYESQLLAYENLLKGKNETEADAIRQKLQISTGLAGARQDIKEATYEINKATIKAPFTGIIADVHAQQGELLRPGQELFRIYDPKNLYLEVSVLESDISLLRKGMASKMNPISSPDLNFSAAVYEINPYVDVNGMVLVKLKLVNGEKSMPLFPGMNCTATIKVPSQKSIVIPKEAVVMRSGKAVVFTLEDGKAKWNYVTVARENGIEIEVKDGLQAGVKVITTNNLQLAHDAFVEEEGSKENQ